MYFRCSSRSKIGLYFLPSFKKLTMSIQICYSICSSICPSNAHNNTVILMIQCYVECRLQCSWQGLHSHQIIVTDLVTPRIRNSEKSTIPNSAQFTGMCTIPGFSCNLANHVPTEAIHFFHLRTPWIKPWKTKRPNSSPNTSCLLL